MNNSLRRKKSKENLQRRGYDIIWMLVPGIILVTIFCYIPMGGLIISFQDYNIFAGIQGSKWVGFKHFIKFFSRKDIFRIVGNTTAISGMNILFGFPVPLIIALLLNEIRSVPTKRIVQTFIYLPHFLSWVIVYGMVATLLSSGGSFMRLLFGADAPSILTNKNAIRPLLVLTDIWKGSGWGTIVYLSALSAVDMELYESAYMDGAGRFRRMWHITLPSIMPTIIMLLIMRVGGLMSANTEQALLFQNDLVLEKGDVIGTYVYRMGLTKMEYSMSTAIGLFNSIINMSMVIGTNYLNRKLIGRSLW